jgi:hypothetical protein
MDLQLLPVRATLVDLRVQVLQASRLSTMPTKRSALSLAPWALPVSGLLRMLGGSGCLEVELMLPQARNGIIGCLVIDSACADEDGLLF